MGVKERSLRSEKILEILSDFQDTLPACDIKLAGSYCGLWRGGKQPRPDSDIDILIIGTAKKEDIFLLEGYWEHETGKHIDVHQSSTGKFVFRHGVGGLERVCDPLERREGMSNE